MVDKQIIDEEAVFNAALAIHGADKRAAYLRDACDGNADLIGRIEALLRVHACQHSFLEEAASSLHLTLDAPEIVERPGSIIGRYKLLEKIGEGGFGVVWAAEQRRPVKRRVALKIIKLGMDTKQVVARFEAERQALALMDHPNIAKILDAGSTDSSRPYFVMELVKGIPITEYCDQVKLSTRARLDLFIRVCNAVQHAHQKGIIHRDIKPSNILITLHDGMPVPRVIDFGIAKATQQELTEKTIYTQHHQFIGTPAYMSPEQAEMSGLDIDTRSDIYSLGVLLYELLTGRTPFDEKELIKSGIDQMRKIIREQEPPRPSTKFATLEIEEQSKTSLRHATDSPRLISLLRGDLDWIVLKCLEKDRARRYETANGLAMDITRHLSNDPVIARPPTVVYRLQKAWRRNKGVYTAAVIVVVSTILGMSLSIWQAIRATRAEEQANANALLAQQRTVEARANEMNALRRAYNSDMSLAFRALEENLFGRVQESVRRHIPTPGEPDFRGWEWRYAWAQSRSDAALAWDAPADMDEVFAIRISPDQRYLVSCEHNVEFWQGGDIRRVWDFQTRQELKHIHLPVGSIHGVGFSYSSRYLALHHRDANGVNDIHVYDTATWQVQTRIPVETGVDSLAFSPDDAGLATIGPLEAVLWDWPRQTVVHTWPVTGRGAHHDVVAFFPDGHHLAIGGQKELKIAHTRTGEITYRQPAPDGGITALAISPNGLYVAIGAGFEAHEIGLLNTVAWTQESALTGHTGWVSSLTFSADSQRLISSSTDNTVRIWDMNDRLTTRILKGHQSEVFSVLLTSDQSRAVSSGKDKRILEWDLNAPPSVFREHVLSEPVRDVVFSPDSQLFYTVDDSGSVGIWDTKSFQKEHASSATLGNQTSIILSADRMHLIAGNGSGQLWVLDARNLQVVAQRSVQSGLILPVGFSAGGQLVVLESGGKISLWNAETWQLNSRVNAGLNIQYYSKDYLAIPPGSDILLCPSGADLLWWDLKRSQALATLRVNSRRSGVIAVSPTEPLLASAARGDFVTLWNWQTREPAGRFRGPDAFMGVAFSPDGRRLVTGSHGKGSLIIWDVSTRQEIARCGASVSGLQHSVQFSPDGNMICAIDAKGIAYFLSAPSFESINAIETQQREDQRR